jgi:hypothetical protein
MNRFLRSSLALLSASFLPIFVEASASADIPAGYAGKPFDPAVAGGVGIIPTTVKAGPYSIPGRLDFVNYDMGGEMVAFHAGDHILDKAGHGYRTDMPVPTFSKTSTTEGDVWYDNGNALDGTPYPSTTTTDFYIGAVQVGDWFNFTVNVQTAGTYSVSSTWSSGNGPPGGEGGDGSMGLEVFVNGTKLATWTAEFPNYQTTTNFHNWKSYPNFATIALQAGPQLIKLQSTSKHLNLDYVDIELAGADGGAATSADASTSGDASSSGASSGSSGGSGSASGTSTGTGASSGTVATSSGSSASGSVVATSGSTAASGSAGPTTGSGAGTPGGSASGGTSATGGTSSGAPAGAAVSSHGTGCSIVATKRSSGSSGAMTIALAALFMARVGRRRARSS